MRLEPEEYKLVLKIGGNMKELEEIIYDIDMKIYELRQDEDTPQIIIEGFLLARKHLGKAYNILNEGGDY